MTKEEINEGNKIIAEFMCGAYKISAITLELDKDKIYLNIDQGDEAMYQIIPRHERYALKYNYSWDWLMPVIEKIENITNGASYLYSFEMGKDWCAITTNDFEPETVVAKSVAGSKIQSVWLAVVEFIKWHKINH